MVVKNKYKDAVTDDDVYIGRGSRWGNPFVIGKDGDRDAVCEKYRAHLWKQIRTGVITRADLASLHGKDLVCFCAPKRCHGDTIMKAVEWAVSDGYGV